MRRAKMNELKSRQIRWLYAKPLDLPTLVALRPRIAQRAFALLKTVGRRSGKRNLTPIGNGLIGNNFWLIPRMRPPKQLSTPDEVARLPSWLSSDARPLVNGATITIDGGRLAGMT